MKSRFQKQCWKIFLFFLIVVNSSALFSQEYIRAIGGSGNDIGHSIVQDNSDNSLIITGSTNSYSYGYVSSKAIIVKYKLGTIYPYLYFNWAKVIGKEGNNYAFCIQIDQEGYYVICGRSRNVNTNDSDIFLAKSKVNGEIIFENIYDVNGVCKTDIAKALAVDNDTNYVIVGTTYSDDPQGDILIAKFQPDGTPLWAQSLGDSNVSERGTAIIQAYTGEYVLVGSTGSDDSTDIVIAKFNKQGIILNSVRLDGVNHHEDMPLAIVDVPSDTFYTIAGYTRSLENTASPDSCLMIFRINQNLNEIQWSKVLKRDECAVALSLVKTPFDEFIVSGYTHNNLLENPGDVLFAQFALNGFFRGAKTFSSSLEMNKKEEAICVTNIYNPDNGLRGYVATGFTESSFLGASDIFVNTFTHESICCYDDIDVEIFNMELSINKFIASTRKSLNRSDSLLNDSIHPDTVCICYQGMNAVVDCELIAGEFNIEQNYPNPFNPTTEIRYSLPTACNAEIIIFNILGEKVTTLVSEFQQQGQHAVVWNGKNDSNEKVTSGVYMFTLKAGNYFEMKKMVMLK